MYKNKRLSVANGCPLCGETIYDISLNGKKAVAKKNNKYSELWVLYDDESNALFGICKKCVETVTLEQAQEIQKDQVFTWGREIIDTPLGLSSFHAQLEWFVKTAVRLRITKISRSKDGLFS